MQSRTTLKYCCLAALFAALLPSCFAAQGGKPALRWGADTQSGAPYAFHSGGDFGKIVGFEADISAELARRLGREPVHVQNEWGSLIPGLGRNLYDFAVGGLEITPEHLEEVNFSIPYYITYEQLVVREGTNDIDSLEDCRSRPVGTLKSSLAETLLKRDGARDIRGYEQEVSAFEDLSNGRLDAVLIDAPVAIYYAGLHPGLKFVPKPVGKIEYGIAIAKTNKALLADVNKALTEMKKSGRLREILEDWKLWNTLTAAEFQDFSVSRTPPAAYEAFVRSHGVKLSWKEKFSRYAGFLPVFGKALLVTLEVSVAAMCLAILLGFSLALCRLYAPAPIAWLAVAYIEVVRGTPLLIQLFLIFYGLPHIGIKLYPLVAGIAGLGLNYAACEAENYRAGLLAVPRGQMEAAIALGMTRWQSIRHVIIPQATRIVIPPVTNDFIALLKDSSLVSMITLVELTGAYSQLSTTYYDYLGIGLMVAVIYLLAGLPFVRLARWTERRLATDVRAGVERPGSLSFRLGN